MTKNIYLLGISVAVGFAILYLVWKQKKQLEYLAELTRSIQPVPISNVVDKDFFIQEAKQIHQKIENSYDRVHQQYIEIISTLDNMQSLDGDIYMANDEEGSENIRSYHAENLIDIDQPIDSLNFPMEEQPIPTSLLGVGEISGVVYTSDKTAEKSLHSSINELKISDDKHSSEPIQEQAQQSVNIEKDVVSYSVNSKTPKLAELRNLCKQNGLSSYGNKKELLERLSKVNIHF